MNSEHENSNPYEPPDLRENDYSSGLEIDVEDASDGGCFFIVRQIYGVFMCVIALALLFPILFLIVLFFMAFLDEGTSNYLITIIYLVPIAFFLMLYIFSYYLVLSGRKLGNVLMCMSCLGWLFGAFWTAVQSESGFPGFLLALFFVLSILFQLFLCVCDFVYRLIFKMSGDDGIPSG